MGQDDHGFAVWGDRAQERQNADRPIVAWTDSPGVSRHYILPAISGVPDRNWLEWAARRYFSAPVGLALSIGSGDGGLERHGLSLAVARRFEGVDTSAGAVAVARRLAREHHIEDRVDYVVADLNRHRFGAARYDAAFASMAVHHIRELEHLFAELRRALKP